jgi:hypothetical protein
MLCRSSTEGRQAAVTDWFYSCSGYKIFLLQDFVTFNTRGPMVQRTRHLSEPELDTGDTSRKTCVLFHE